MNCGCMACRVYGVVQANMLQRQVHAQSVAAWPWLQQHMVPMFQWHSLPAPSYSHSNQTHLAADPWGPNPSRLYFKTLGWLRLLFLWLALGTVPFLVVITSSKFTSPALAASSNTSTQQGPSYSSGSGAAEAASWDAPETGVMVYPQVNGSQQMRTILVGVGSRSERRLEHGEPASGSLLRPGIAGLVIPTMAPSDPSIPAAALHNFPRPPCFPSRLRPSWTRGSTTACCPGGLVQA
jgi:hypothetical protein